MRLKTVFNQLLPNGVPRTVNPCSTVGMFGSSAEQSVPLLPFVPTAAANAQRSLDPIDKQ